MRGLVRIRVLGACFAATMLVGCSSLPGLDSGGVPFVEDAAEKQAKANEEAFKKTGRPATNGVLAVMDNPPNELYTHETGNLDPSWGCNEDSSCMTVWHQVDEDQVVANASSLEGTEDESGGASISGVDLASGEVTWTSESDSFGGCAATSAALACIGSGEDEYTLSTVLLDDGTVIEEASFGGGQDVLGLGGDASVLGATRYSDNVYMSGLWNEYDDQNELLKSTLYVAKIAADGTIEWLVDSPVEEIETRANTVILDGQVLMPPLKTPDGDPLAVDADSGEIASIDPDNASTWSRMRGTSQVGVDDGSAEGYQFPVELPRSKLPEITGVQVAGSDPAAEPLWPIPADSRIEAVCAGTVVLTTPFGEENPYISVRDPQSGDELWTQGLTFNSGVSCDGARIIIAEEHALSALEATSGDLEWIVDAPWDDASSILPFEPLGISTRFAVIGSQEDPDTFADTDTITVYEAP